MEYQTQKKTTGFPVPHGTFVSVGGTGAWFTIYNLARPASREMRQFAE